MLPLTLSCFDNFRRLLLLGSLLLSLPGTGQTAQEMQKAESVRIKTELVQIDVVVKDQKGSLVHDLRREDFEVLEDGKAQQVTHFALGTAKQPAAYLSPESPKAEKKGGEMTTADAIATGRHIVLAIDDYHLAPENLVAVKLSLARFIEQELAPNDEVALVVTSGALGLYQQFTRDRTALLRAINRLSLQNRTTALSSGIPQITDYQAELIDQNDTSALQSATEEVSLRRGRGLGTPPDRRGLSNPRNSDEGVVRAKARSIVMENARYTAVTLSTLEKTIRGLRELPGRKVVVLLSDGFFTASLHTYTSYDYRRITDAATRAGVVIYTLDARGLVAKPTLGSASDQAVVPVSRVPDARRRMTQGEIGARQEGLFVLARDTGGIPFFNNNDLNIGLRQVLDDTGVYYVLAYEPTNTASDGRFRKIEVRLASRPELKIQTRAGYFAPAASTEAIDARKRDTKASKKAPAQSYDTAQMQAALSSLVPLRGIPLEAAAHFLHTPQTGPLALITAKIDATELGIEAQNNQRPAVLDVVGVIFNESGKSVSNFNQSYELKFGENSRAQWGTFQYHNVTPLPPGIYNIRLAIVGTGTTRAGSVSEWIEIPDVSNKKLALSSILLAEEGGEFGDIYNALAATLQPQKKSAETPANTIRLAHRFKSGANLDFLLFAYNAQPNAQGAGELGVQIKVYKGETEIYSSPPDTMTLSAEQAVQGAACEARLSLLLYQRGKYELRIEITDRVAKISATQTVPFTVE